MKNTINEQDFITGCQKSFGYHGSIALYNYLTSFEDETGEELEFDPIGFRVEFCLYENLQECLKENGFRTLKELEDHTTVIRVPETKEVIIQNF